ncbi:MAG TPA: YciI family protein, partial [Solirubrobacterales bacterium]|nr:YciI family protein [Solirubrobacterales bacterium]
EPDRSLTEEHWAYMDRFADGMTAQGPTLAGDRDTWTGSLHVVDLPDADAARKFVEHEPYNRAGMFKSHVIRRFENLLGRTMWEFPRDSADPRFLVFAHLNITAPQRQRLIIHGELSTLDEAAPAGVVLALQAPTREAVDDVLKDGLVRLDEPVVEIHDWELGGRR